MTIGSNLSLRLAAIMLLGFILLQLMIVSVVVPSAQDMRRPYNLPRPEEAAAIANAIDRAPLAERPALVGALGGAFYSVQLVSGPVPPLAGEGDDLGAVQAAYSAAMPGRAVIVDGRRPRFGRLIGSSPRPARFFAPIRIAIGLRRGGMLLVTSQPSPTARVYLRDRSTLGALGGLLLLAVLLLAVRQTTRPLARLSRGVRQFARDLDMPDLPEKGPREVRELAAAFNDMKGQIRALIGERTRVLAAVAHDFRTYLTRLRLRAEFIDDPDHRARAIRDLEEMTALINDTLTLAERDSTSPMRRSRIALAAELSAIVETRREMGEAVVLDPVPEGLAIEASRLALRRILANLIDNGLRYGSCVRIGVHAAKDTVSIVVEDDGPGVPGDALAGLGELFHRVDPSRSRDTGGAGLGLAIVRALADRDGATVSFGHAEPSGLRVRLVYRRSGELDGSDRPL